MTRRVMCGSVPIGGGAPITIQSMTNTYTEDVKATVSQIESLAMEGCDIVRCAAPTMEAARAIGEIKAKLKASQLLATRSIQAPPVVADVHFDHRIALAAIKAGADKVRLNPGNIGGPSRLREVADAARAAGIPIRVGVNSGSIEKDILSKYGGPSPEALSESAMKSAEFLSEAGFEDIVLSLKSSDVAVNTKAHIFLSEKCDLPLHIGITEAGTGVAAERKSAVGIGALLVLGIGDTVRVSLTGDPVSEIAVARDILRAADKLPGAVELISCPTCGRCRGNLAETAALLSGLVREFENSRIREIKRLISEGKEPPKSMTSVLRAAVMGCEVNGPGEAKNADVGAALTKDKAVYFEKGKKIATIGVREIPRIVMDGLGSLHVYAKSTEYCEES